MSSGVVWPARRQGYHRARHSSLRASSSATWQLVLHTMLAGDTTWLARFSGCSYLHRFLVRQLHRAAARLAQRVHKHVIFDTTCDNHLGETTRNGRLYLLDARREALPCRFFFVSSALLGRSRRFPLGDARSKVLPHSRGARQHSRNIAIMLSIRFSDSRSSTKKGEGGRVDNALALLWCHVTLYTYRPIIWVLSTRFCTR